jgi:hypothetical protein
LPVAVRVDLRENLRRDVDSRSQIELEIEPLALNREPRGLKVLVKLVRRGPSGPRHIKHDTCKRKQ